MSRSCIRFSESRKLVSGVTEMTGSDMMPLTGTPMSQSSLQPYLLLSGVLWPVYALQNILQAYHPH